MVGERATVMDRSIRRKNGTWMTRLSADFRRFLVQAINLCESAGIRVIRVPFHLCYTCCQ